MKFYATFTCFIECMYTTFLFHWYYTFIKQLRFGNSDTLINFVGAIWKTYSLSLYICAEIDTRGNVGMQTLSELLSILKKRS